MRDGIGQMAFGAGNRTQEQLALARQRHKPIDRDMVSEVVKTVLTTMSGDLTATETSLLHEVEALGRTISAAKQEIAALREELKLPPMDLQKNADDLEFLPPEFEQKAHPGMVAFERQARGIAAAKLRAMGDHLSKT